jgi:hypothetical protein
MRPDGDATGEGRTDDPFHGGRVSRVAATGDVDGRDDVEEGVLDLDKLRALSDVGVQVDRPHASSCPVVSGRKRIRKAPAT